MAKKDIFEGAVIIGALPVTSRTAKVVKLLTSGQVCVGAEYRSADGRFEHRTGGILFPDLDSLAKLVEQAKAREVVRLEDQTFPEPVKAERNPSATTAKIDALTEQVAQLTALIANSMTATTNGKVKVAS